MDPANPVDAQRIVTEYARLLEHHAETDAYPLSVSTLPYAKPIIKQAIQTSVIALVQTGQMTDELRQYLEVAYTSLADYLDDELVRVMTDHQRASTAFAVDARFAREKADTPAWRTLSETSGLVGQIAQTVADDVRALREEFSVLLGATS
jgi:hypothetical protein